MHGDEPDFNIRIMAHDNDDINLKRERVADSDRMMSIPRLSIMINLSYSLYLGTAVDTTGATVSQPELSPPH